MLGNASRPLAALVFCTAALFAVPGEAQNLPWPSDSPKRNAPAAPWPSAAPGGSAPTPAAASPPPMTGMPGAGPMTPVPQAAGPGGGGAPCMAEFTKLQNETDRLGKAARDAGKRKVSREEMCAHLKSFAGAIGKWAKFTADKASSCGIPSKVVDQLKTGATNIAKNRDQVCADGTAGPGKPPTPTLSDALGATIMPTPDTTTKPSVATGTLDTLTGVPIGR